MTLPASFVDPYAIAKILIDLAFAFVKGDMTASELTTELRKVIDAIAEALEKEKLDG